MSDALFRTKMRGQVADLLVEMCEDELVRLATEIAACSPDGESATRLAARAALVMEAHGLFYRDRSPEPTTDPELEGPRDGQPAHPPGTSRDTRSDPKRVP